MFGNLFWTFIEYVMHRFLFHLDDLLPDHPYALTLHFLLHGIHHYVPMDRLRLVMPPILFFALSYPFTRLAHAIFPTHVANGVISGSFAFYVRALAHGSSLTRRSCTTADTTRCTTPSCRSTWRR